MDKDA